jgi:hypothetical protein
LSLARLQFQELIHEAGHAKTISYRIIERSGRFRPRGLSLRTPKIVPAMEALNALVSMLDGTQGVTLLRGRGCAGARGFCSGGPRRMGDYPDILNKCAC